MNKKGGKRLTKFAGIKYTNLTIISMLKIILTKSLSKPILNSSRIAKAKIGSEITPIKKAQICSLGNRI
jgi:hypothetical protein